MTDLDSESNEIELARITVTRVLTDGDDEIRYETEGEPRFIDAVGMMQIALDLILREGLDGEGDD